MNSLLPPPYKSYTLALFLFVFAPLLAWGQETALPYNLPSANAASLGKYGDVPVSYYTGAASIGIPISTLDVRGVKMPISLSYDASGVRVNSQPSWVGQNWSLNIGGVITRSVQGGPDESLGFSPFGFGTHPYFSMVKPSNILRTQDISSVGVLRDIPWKASLDGVLKDYEPDIFMFNFMGMSGRFFMGDDGTWRVVGNAQLEVVYDINDQGNLVMPLFDKLPYWYEAKRYQYSLSIYGIKLRDGQGNLYTFGYNQNAIEYTLPFFGQLYQGDTPRYDSWTANAWYLTKVEDAHGQILYNLEYERGYYTANLHELASKTGTVCWGAKAGAFGAFHNAPVASSNSSIRLNIGGDLISPVYLKRVSTLDGQEVVLESSDSPYQPYTQEEVQYEISTLNQTLVNKCQKSNDPYIISLCGTNPLYFLQDASSPYTYKGFILPGEDVSSMLWHNPVKAMRWRKLDKVKIAGVADYSLLYDVAADRRLNLKGVSILPPGGQSVSMKYTLDYNRFEEFPTSALSRFIDHWGYYNGNNAFSVNENNLAAYYGIRQSNSALLTIGMLKSITYPTGGLSVFEFEPHEYAFTLSNDKKTLIPSNGIAGGVRIKRIQDVDGNGQTIDRQFFYKKNYATGGTNSSGILAYKPNYYWPNWRVRTEYDMYYEQSVFSSNLVLPQANSFGPHIEYAEVVEKLANGGYSIYHYTTNEQALYRNEPPAGSLNIEESPYTKGSDRSALRGQLLKKASYRNDGKLLSQIEYAYRTDANKEQEFGLGFDGVWASTCTASPADRYYRGTAYKIYYFDYDVVEEKQTNFDESGNVFTSNTTYNKFNYFTGTLGRQVRLTRETVTTQSNSQILKVKYTYPSDRLTEPEMNELMKRNQLFMPIQTETFNGSTATGATKLIFGYDNYSRLMPKELQESETDTNELETKLIYKAYDKWGNPAELQRPGDVSSVLVWGYGGKHLVAEVKNTTLSQVSHLLSDIWYWSGQDNDFCTDGSQNCKENVFRGYLNKIRTAAPLAMVNTFTYNKGGVLSSAQSADGRFVYYEYDALNRLKYVKDHDGNLVKSYEYANAAYGTAYLSDIWAEGSLLQGATCRFGLEAYGGSGALSYKWIVQGISGGSYYREFYTERAFSLFCEYAGSIVVTCEATDLVTGKKYTRTTVRSISAVPYQFSGTAVLSKSSTWIEKKASIYSPIATNIQLAFRCLSSTGGRISVNGQFYSFPGYGTQYITVAAQAGQTIQVQAAVGNYGEVEIMSMDNQYAKKGTVSKITLSVGE